MQSRYLFLILLTVGAPSVAYTTCQQLARSFSENSALMSDNELAQLRTCVTNALQHRISESNPLAVPPMIHVPMSSPPPAPAAKPAPSR